MAIHHFHREIASRTSGKSAVAAAYLRTGEIKDYSRKRGVLDEWVQTPDRAPAWASDRVELWNRVEAREDRSTRRAHGWQPSPESGARPYSRLDCLTKGEIRDTRLVSRPSKLADLPTNSSARQYRPP